MALHWLKGLSFPALPPTCEMLPLVWQLSKAYAVFGVVYVCCRLLWYYICNRSTMRHLSKLPGDNGHWFWGVIPKMAERFDELLDYRFGVQQANAGAPIIRFNEPLISTRGATLATADPAIIKHMLKDQFSSWNKPHADFDIFFTLFRKWMGSGIFTIQHGEHREGRMWYHQRKTSSHIFTKSNFKFLMRDTFLSKSRVMIDEISSAMDQHHESPPLDMQSMFFAFTMDSIMQIFFGCDTDTLRGKADPFADAFDEAHRSLLRFVLSNMAVLTSMKMFLPWPFGGNNGLALRLYRNLHPIGIRFNRSVAALTRESKNIIQKRRKDPSLAESRDLLALFMQSEAVDGTPMSAEHHTDELRDIILNFVIAGRDTSACTLTWMFYILATNPDVQERLVEEIDSVLGSEEPDFEDLSASRMPYLNGVVYEALRLYPPVPVDPKVCTAPEGDTIPDGKGGEIHIPRDTTMLYCPYFVGRDPIRYPDPDKVDPERWIPFKQPDMYDFPVFQAGPRICLGRDMAVFETKTLAVRLLQEFTFTLREGEAERITYSAMLTMSLCNSKGDKERNCKGESSHELWLTPHRRHQA